MSLEQRLADLEAQVERLTALNQENVSGIMLTLAALIYLPATDKPEFIRLLQDLLKESQRAASSSDLFMETCLTAILVAKAAIADEVAFRGG